MSERISSYGSCDLTFICFPWLGEKHDFSNTFLFLFVCRPAKRLQLQLPVLKLFFFTCLKGDVMWRTEVENFSQELENHTGYQHTHVNEILVSGATREYQTIKKD